MKMKDEKIRKFIQLIVQNYDIGEDELLELWKNNSSPSDDFERFENYDKLKKVELQQLCREKGYKVTGTKGDLIQRLTSSNPSPKKQAKVPHKKSQKIPTILKMLNEKANEIPICRNKFDHFEHAETKLVFDEITHKVKGKQCHDTGAVLALTDEDYDTCKEFKFDFDLPETLED